MRIEAFAVVQIAENRHIVDAGIENDDVRRLALVDEVDELRQALPAGPAGFAIVDDLEVVRDLIEGCRNVAVIIDPRPPYGRAAENPIRGLPGWLSRPTWWTRTPSSEMLTVWVSIARRRQPTIGA